MSVREGGRRMNQAPHGSSPCSDHAQEQTGQRGCGVSLTRNIPEPSEHKPVPCALGSQNHRMVLEERGL